MQSRFKSKAYFAVSFFFATTSSFMHDWSRHSILSQSGDPFCEKYITVIHVLGSARMNQLPLQRRMVRQTLFLFFFLFFFLTANKYMYIQTYK